MLQIFYNAKIPAGIKKAETSFVARPEPAQSFCAITTRKKRGLNFGGLCLVGVSVQRGEDRMRRWQWQVVRAKILKWGERRGFYCQSCMPNSRTFSLQSFLKTVFGGGESRRTSGCGNWYWMHNFLIPWNQELAEGLDLMMVDLARECKRSSFRWQIIRKSESWRRWRTAWPGREPARKYTTQSGSKNIQTNNSLIRGQISQLPPWKIGLTSVNCVRGGDERRSKSLTLKKANEPWKKVCVVSNKGLKVCGGMLLGQCGGMLLGQCGGMLLGQCGGVK